MMRIYFNNRPIDLADENITVAELLRQQNVKSGGTAVAVNNKIVTHDIWEIKQICDGDSVMVISAAFGG
ncbi:sulfur carrier protein ThiS [uncultured Duncaniella sp.]|mgnify:CR=1 FL=1|uniref:sulfur carrier protein ThiS n=1 Tax=uncultured Duncaniella sp. TaxID=2768039 RepID=UPI002659788F|nr:sulfur carrier protein ThiS [uncultured Duncaniella sp.]